MKTIINPHKSRYFILLLALAVALAPAFSPSQPAYAATCTVTSSADDGSAGTLRSLLAEASCDTITFDSGPRTIHLDSQLEIDRNVTIDGSWHDIVISGDNDNDGSGEVRLFNIASGVNVNLKNMAMEKGFSSSSGGAIYNNGTLNITSIAFSGNSTNDVGGAIFSSGSGTLNVTASTFSGNSAFYAGGAIADGGDNKGSLTVTESTFSGNSATGDSLSEGGAVNSWGATFTQNTFYQNQATWRGGAVRDAGGPIFINNTFVGNSAPGKNDPPKGGAVFTWGGSSPASFINNTFVGNRAFQGGAIGFNSGSYNVYNNLLVDNGSSCYYADTYGVTINGSNNLLDVDGCGNNFTKYSSDSLNIGTLGDYGGPTQTVPLLQGSVAIEGGNDDQCPDVDQREIGRPQWWHCDVGAFELQVAWGPVIITEPRDQRVWVGDKTNFNVVARAYPDLSVEWQESRDGGATWGIIAGGVTTTTDNHGTINSTLAIPASLDRNKYQYRAVFNNGRASITSNVTTLYVPSPFTVTSDLDDGSAGTLRAAVTDQSCYPITFDGSHTIHLASPLEINWLTTIDGTGHTVVISGDKDGDGNGDIQVFKIASGVTANLSHLTVEKGKSDQGAIWNQGGTLTVSDSILSANYGAIVNDGGSLTVTGSTFSGNSAASSSAVTISSGTATIAKNTFDGNSSIFGGGAIVFYGGDSAVSQNTFVRNSSTHYGGAVYNFGGTATFTNNTFTENSTNGEGGAVYARWDTMFTNNTFVGNSAGSGSTFFFDNGTHTLHNNLVWRGSNGASCSKGNSLYLTIAGSNNLADDNGCGTNVFTQSAGILLGTLGNYGGSTQTIPLLPGSLAIDTGDNVACPETDQRGMTRQDGDQDGIVTCDIGSYEVDAVMVDTDTSLDSSVNSPVEMTPITFTATVSPAPDGGTVAFKDGGIVISGCGAQPVTGGQATCTTSTMRSRIHFITAEYSGYGTYNPSVSAVFLQGVNVPAAGDSTPPVITPDIQGTLGQNGWYTSDVILTWTVADSQSTITSKTGCDPVFITSDQQDTAYTCTATSAGGTNTVTVNIKRDATAPTLSPVVTPDPVLLHGSATASPNAGDATSGVASSSCDAVDTSSVGSHTVACTATDNAGNTATASASYTVNYNFVGFSSPVDMNGILNTAKAGQMVPLKWRLLDASGNPVLNLDPATVTMSISPYACPSGVATDAIETYATGTSTLQNLGDGYYQLNWKTDKAFANSCRRLTLKIGDWSGDGFIALFQFKK